MGRRSEATKLRFDRDVNFRNWTITFRTSAAAEVAAEVPVAGARSEVPERRGHRKPAIVLLLIAGLWEVIRGFM